MSSQGYHLVRLTVCQNRNKYNWTIDTGGKIEESNITEPATVERLFQLTASSWILPNHAMFNCIKLVST